MTPEWELAIDEVVNIWEQGADISDPHLLKECSLYKNAEVNRELLQCNSQIFKCFFDKRPAKIKYKGEWIPYQVESIDSAHQRDDLDIILTMEKKAQKRKLSLTLKNNCHKIILPQGYYMTRFFKKSDRLKDRLWHTSGIRYSIDKYLVRNFEVLNWAKQREHKDIIDHLKNKNLFAVSTDLKSTQMKSFCQDHGEEVLSSKVHDALTFHHGRQALSDIANIPPSVNAAPHPFGPRKDDGPQFKSEFNSKECFKVYSKECLDQKVLRSFPESIGWSGVAELLGGEMEFVINPYLPRRNLIASSFYFPFDSHWHRAGEFAYWDGRSHEKRNFNFYGVAPELDRANNSPLKVGFRCMSKQYIEQEKEREHD